MIQLFNKGAYVFNGNQVVAEEAIGAEYKKYSLKLFDHSMAVKGMAPANANGKNQRFVEEKNISLFGFITLPVKYSVTTYTVYEKSEKKVSKAQAQKQYSEKLEEWKKRPIRQKLKQAILHIFAPLM